MRNVLLLWIAFVGSATAQSTGDLRLVRNGLTSSSYTSGRLEVYYNGQWGTVCDDDWDYTNTLVACRQLGLSTAAATWTTSSLGGFGSATGRIWLDNVNCFGTESRLTSCSRNPFGVENCLHSEDVAIYCDTSIVSNAVAIGVGVSISCLVVFVIIPIIVCVVIACAISRSSRRTRTTVTTVPPTSSTTVVTTSSQQPSAQQPSAQQSAYQPAGTDFKQAPLPPYEMSAYPPQPQGGYPQQGYPPQGYSAQP